MKKFRRITIDPEQMDGVPCVRGLRIPVATVIGLLAEGLSLQEILDDYPDLEKEDVDECLHFAAITLQEKQIPILTK